MVGEHCMVQLCHMARFWLRSLLLGVGLGLILPLLLIWISRHPQPRLHSPPATDEDLPDIRLQTLIGLKRGPRLFPPPVVGNQSNVHHLQSAADLCRWVEPWFADKTWPNTHLIFYGKPIMQAVKSICVHRHWKMTMILNDSSSGLMELKRLSSLGYSFTITFTSSRALRHPVIHRLANSTNALVSAIRYAYKITGAKKGQLEAFRNHFHSYGCTLEEMNVMPRSFLLDSSLECVQFFKYANSRPSSWWVLKTSQGYGGDGITVLPNLTSLHNRFGRCSKQNGEFIVQEYLSDLLLVEGRKFDVRGLVLIAGTNPYMLFYHDGYLRVSVKNFDMHGDRSVHLTNSHVQVHSDGFAPEKHFWSFARFQEFLDKNVPENDRFVERSLIPFIKKTSLFILRTGLNIFERAPSTFQFLGLDFMVTRDLHTWFIEANNYPLWPKGTPFIDNLIDTLGNDMFDLLFELRKSPGRFTHMAPGEWYKSWQLVWSEVDAKCSDNTPPYNPCEEFIRA